MSHEGIAEALATTWPEDLAALETRPGKLDREPAMAAIQALLRAVMPARRAQATPRPGPEAHPLGEAVAWPESGRQRETAFSSVGPVAVPAPAGRVGPSPAGPSPPLTAAPEPAQPAKERMAGPGKPLTISRPAREERSASAPPAPDPGFGALPGYARESEASSREWELVLPKMPKLMQPPRRLRRVKGPLLEANYHPEVRFETGNDLGLASRIWANLPERARKAVLAALLIPAAWLGWRALSPPAEPTEVAASTFVMGQGGWMTDWATDPGGSKRGRQLSLYRPSMALSDYRLDFTGRIERKALGWVFRASNTRNYYGARIELVRDGRFPTVALSHFFVVEGRESAAPAKLIPVMIEAGKPYQVRFEARGPKFTAWVQDQVVDLWEDGQLKSGGVGFFTERQEQAKILDFRLSVQK